MKIDELCKEIVRKPDHIEWPEQLDLIGLIKEAADTFMKEQTIVRTTGDMLFVGDVHGDLDAMVSAFMLADEAGSKIVFLGDVVDRGSRQVRTINLLLARKLLHPETVFFVRGNHEFKEVNTRWGFADAVMEHYSETVYWLYNTCFTALPLAVLLNEKVLGLHGGLGEHTPTLQSIDNIERTSLPHLDDRTGMLWNDPAEKGNGFTANNKRGLFFTFCRDVFDEFMEKNDLALLVRAHEELADGHKYFFDNQLISVFSSADHYKKVKPKAVLVKADGGHEILSL